MAPPGKRRRRRLSPMDLPPPEPDPRDRLPLTEGGPLWRAMMMGTTSVPKEDRHVFIVAPDQTRVALAIIPWPTGKLYWLTPRAAKAYAMALLHAAELAEQGVPTTQEEADDIRRAVQSALLGFESHE